MFCICTADKNYIFRFIDKIPGEFFTSAQRSMVVWEVLLRTPYGDEAKERVLGILYSL